MHNLVRFTVWVVLLVQAARVCSQSGQDGTGTTASPHSAENNDEEDDKVGLWIAVSVLCVAAAVIVICIIIKVKSKQHKKKKNNKRKMPKQTTLDEGITFSDISSQQNPTTNTENIEPINTETTILENHQRPQVMIKPISCAPPLLLNVKTDDSRFEGNETHQAVEAGQKRQLNRHSDSMQNIYVFGDTNTSNWTKYDRKRILNDINEDRNQKQIISKNMKTVSAAHNTLIKNDRNDVPNDSHTNTKHTQLSGVASHSTEYTKCWEAEYGGRSLNANTPTCSSDDMDLPSHLNNSQLSEDLAFRTPRPQTPGPSLKVQGSENTGVKHSGKGGEVNGSEHHCNTNDTSNTESGNRSVTADNKLLNNPTERWKGKSQSIIQRALVSDNGFYFEGLPLKTSSPRSSTNVTEGNEADLNTNFAQPVGITKQKLDSRPFIGKINSVRRSLKTGGITSRLEEPMVKASSRGVQSGIKRSDNNKSDIKENKHNTYTNGGHECRDAIKDSAPIMFKADKSFAKRNIDVETEIANEKTDESMNITLPPRQRNNHISKTNTRSCTNSKVNHRKKSRSLRNIKSSTSFANQERLAVVRHKLKRHKSSSSGEYTANESILHSKPSTDKMENQIDGATSKREMTVIHIKSINNQTRSIDTQPISNNIINRNVQSDIQHTEIAVLNKKNKIDNMLNQQELSGIVKPENQCSKTEKKEFDMRYTELSNTQISVPEPNISDSARRLAFKSVAPNDPTRNSKFQTNNERLSPYRALSDRENTRSSRKSDTEIHVLKRLKHNVISESSCQYEPKFEKQLQLVPRHILVKPGKITPDTKVTADENPHIAMDIKVQELDSSTSTSSTEMESERSPGGNPNGQCNNKLGTIDCIPTKPTAVANCEIFYTNKTMEFEQDVNVPQGGSNQQLGENATGLILFKQGAVNIPAYIKMSEKPYLTVRPFRQEVSNKETYFSDNTSTSSISDEGETQNQSSMTCINSQTIELPDSNAVIGNMNATALIRKHKQRTNGNKKQTKPTLQENDVGKEAKKAATMKLLVQKYKSRPSTGTEHERFGNNVVMFSREMANTPGIRKMVNGASNEDDKAPMTTGQREEGIMCTYNNNTERRTIKKVAFRGVSRRPTLTLIQSTLDKSRRERSISRGTPTTESSRHQSLRKRSKSVPVGRKAFPGYEVD